MGEKPRLPSDTTQLIIEGGDGDDLIEVFDHYWTVLDGGAGHDVLWLWGGGDLSGIVGFEEIYTDGVTLADENAAAGSTLVIGTIPELGGVGVLYVDGSAETDAHLDMTGGAQSNILTGGMLSDTLRGGAQADTLSGGGGDDVIEAGLGDDTLTGGAGNDTLIGGDGIDTAIFSGAYGDYVITTGFGFLTVRRQTFWDSRGADLAESWPRLGLIFRRRFCGAASADFGWSAV